MTGLPASGLLAGWLSACLEGAAAPDQMTAALERDDPTLLHRFAGLGADAPVLALGALRASGGTGCSVALPAPGDPTGLAGPAAFNTEALEAGEAVVVHGAGLGLVPDRAGDVVTWTALSAELPRPGDAAQADRDLRRTLSEVTNRLVDLDVARWEPEIADLVQNVRHRPPLRLPPTFDGPALERIDRAVLCGEIVRLGLSTSGAAVSASEIETRRAVLEPLDRAARHALVAALDPRSRPLG